MDSRKDGRADTSLAAHQSNRQTIKSITLGDGNTPMPSGDGAQPATRQVLGSWKEIAVYLKRGVRTVQRYERQFHLPVHRAGASDHTSSVMAFTDEIDGWLQAAETRRRRYVRPTLVVLDRPIAGTVSGRKLVLEVHKFNVLTAYSVEEAYSTGERYDVDGFVLDEVPGSDAGEEMCESLKERNPKKPVFLVTASGDDAPRKCADYVVASVDPEALLTAVLAVFGTPRLE